MKFTAKEEFGLRCMVQMVKLSEGGAVNIVEIAEREALTNAYVAKLMGALRNGGLVVSLRGHQGGYRLARPPENIYLNEVFDALGDRLVGPSFCQRFTGQADCCVHTSDCAIRGLLSGMDQVIYGFLSRCTLADIVEKSDTVERWVAAAGGGNGARGESLVQFVQS